MPIIQLLPYWNRDSHSNEGDPSFAITHFPFVIGRASQCDLRLDDLMVSRRHCVFSFHDGQVWVEDLASRNGTRIDGEPVTASRPVRDGEILQLAHLNFAVRREDFPEEAGPESDGLWGARTGEFDRPEEVRT